MSSTNWDEIIFVDRERSALLWDVGARGYAAAVGVDSDGEEYLALVKFDRLGPDGGSIDVACADQLHEQLGRLPALWRRRINGDPRCGQPTRAGRPCRVKVAYHGDICGVHRRPRRGQLQQHHQAHDADTGRGAP